MSNTSKQLFNGILILLGSSLLAYSLAVTDVDVYVQIVGLIILMVGAYRASSHWAKHKNDHLDE